MTDLILTEKQFNLLKRAFLKNKSWVEDNGLWPILEEILKIDEQKQVTK